MESSNRGSSDIAETKSGGSPSAPSPNPNEHAAKEPVARRAGVRHKLIAYQYYFGLEARSFHAGAERTLARMLPQEAQQARINVRTLSEDFSLDTAASGTLLRTFLAEGLLYPDGNGGYEPSERFREYALAKVIVPLSRPQVTALINAACRFAAGINADSHRNPFLIDTMMVSGGYMSRCELLPELPLWLVLRRRPPSRTRRSTRFLSKDDACRHILTTMKGLNPIMVVRIVSDKQKVERPFSVMFQAQTEMLESPPGAWERLRDWGASINQRVASRQAHANPLPDVPEELVTVQRGPRTLQRDGSAWGGVSKRG